MRQAVETRAIPVDVWPIRKSLTFFSLASILLLFIFVFYKSVDRTVYPIEKVSVEGKLEKLDPGQIQQVVIEAVEGGFFHLSLETVRRKLIEEPWVADAVVTRIWPRALNVKVREHVAVGRWGTQSLISDDGYIFTPISKFESSELVTLVGPVERRMEMLEIHKSVSLRLSRVGIEIASIALSERGSWSFLTSSGLSLVCGKQNVSKKIDRLVLALEKGLLSNWPNVSKIDMRYTNGLSITLTEHHMGPWKGSSTCVGMKCPRREV